MTDRRRPHPAFLCAAAAVLAFGAFAAPAGATAATTVRLSVSSSGRQGNGGSAVAYISAGGRYVVFVSGDTNSVSDIFERDRTTHRTLRVSVANDGSQAIGESHSPRGISPNGRYVTFESFATNLVKGDTNGV